MVAYTIVLCIYVCVCSLVRYFVCLFVYWLVFASVCLFVCVCVLLFCPIVMAIVLNCPRFSKVVSHSLTPLA